MLVIVGIRTEAQDLTSQVGIGSESHCLLGDGLIRIIGDYIGRKPLRCDDVSKLL